VLQYGWYVWQALDEVGRSAEAPPGRQHIPLEPGTLRLERRRRVRCCRTDLKDPGGDEINQRQRPLPEQFQERPTRRSALDRAVMSCDLNTPQVSRRMGCGRPTD
jgi:hypothetical protein